MHYQREYRKKRTADGRTIGAEHNKTELSGPNWKKGQTKETLPGIAAQAVKMKGAHNPSWKGGKISLFKAAKAKLLAKIKKCQRCKATPDPTGAPVVRGLHVHHKNRDKMDNRLSNLEVLCHRCHLVEHWEERREGIERSRA